MYSYYKKSLLKLSRMLHDLEDVPNTNKDNCLFIQKKVLTTLLRIEKNIRNHRGAIKDLRSYLSLGRELKIDKIKAKTVKDKILWHSDRIEEYQQLLITFRSIVDGLAFIYFDKLDIKEMALKEQSGFISGKTGLNFELKIFRLAFSLGHIAILNDLTNCLRYGDVTVLADGRKIIIEAKSGHNRNARIKRQKSALEDISEYLTSGKSNKVYAIGENKGEFIRLPIHSAELNHRDQLNAIISNAHRSHDQYCIAEVEPGLHYVATYVATPEIFTSLTGKPPDSIIISFINKLKYSGLGYYPFSLCFNDPEDWYDFCSGRLMLVVIVETGVIQDKLSQHGISVTITNDWDGFPIKLTENGSDTEQNKSLVGGHFFGRLFYEFLSLDWMLEEFIYHRNRDLD